MIIAYLFSSGILGASLEIHLRSFGFSHISIALCFAFQTITYFILSLTLGGLSRIFDERLIMILGAIILSLSYLMLGPCSVIFPNSAIVVVLALPLSGIGQVLVYCNMIFSV